MGRYHFPFAEAWRGHGDVPRFTEVTSGGGPLTLSTPTLHTSTAWPLRDLSASKEDCQEGSSAQKGAFTVNHVLLGC